MFVYIFKENCELSRIQHKICKRRLEKKTPFGINIFSFIQGCPPVGHVPPPAICYFSLYYYYQLFKLAV